MPPLFRELYVTGFVSDEERQSERAAGGRADTNQAKPRRHIPFWHLLPLTIFFVTNFFLIAWFRKELWQVMDHLAPYQFILLGLATYRIADIIANEQVTKVVRAPFVNVKDEGGDDEEEVPKPQGIRESLGTLL